MSIRVICSRAIRYFALMDTSVANTYLLYRSMNFTRSSWDKTPAYAFYSLLLYFFCFLVKQSRQLNKPGV